MKRIIGIIVVAVIIMIGMFFQLRKNHDKINQSVSNSGISNIVNVNVTKVEKNGIANELNLTGTLYPSTELDIASEAQGQITMLDVELGQNISKGKVIAVIDNELKQLAVRNAKLNESKLKRDLERFQNLYKGGTVTEQQLEDAVNAYEVAQIQLEQAEKQSADATVKAPFSGVIANKFVEEGAFINPGSPVATLINISKLKVKINVSESNIYEVQKGNQAIITTGIYPGAEFVGEVTFVSARGDDSHNYPVEVELTNSKQYPLKAGTFVNVKIEALGTGNGLFIPREALVGSTRDASVFVAENGKAILRKITVKNTGGSSLLVLSGLAEGDPVITAGQINLVDGKEINVVEK